MDRFTRVELTSSLRPALLPNETILAIQDSVGLYEGNEKVPEYSNGKAYLTTHRVIYIDSEHPQTHSLALDLSLVKAREYFTGFLKSSPKLILRFTENLYALSSSPRSHTPISPSSSTTSLPLTTSITPTTWICPICSYSKNLTSTNLKCQLCGVKRPEDLLSAPSVSPLTSQNSKESIIGSNVVGGSSLQQEEHLSQTSDTDSPSAKTPAEGIACPVCTFLNHPSMIRCEVCESELGTFNIDGLSITVDEAVLGSTAGRSGNALPDFVKLAFRNGGIGTFHEKLKVAMSGKEWEKSLEPIPPRSTPDFDPGRGGIKGIARNVEEGQKEQEETLTLAFKDLDGLMAKAKEMVKLAESMKLKLIKESNDSEASADEASSLNTYLLELGISSPELSLQLAEFLEGILERENGMMALTDIYCIFNRARGVALISPEDMYKACSLFEQLNMPMRLRKFPSGLNVVHDEKTAQRILEEIQKNGPKTAIDLAERQKTSVFLMTEAKGLICRDETVEGLRFYENLISNYEWEFED
ncbi:10666_t:CDS:10 [Ambispora gerdemannii]|uniref:Vacuolar protein-sorting-associated protein 36 n=1 Tax=Ambispora gerdemannii TaxID=144530 RepID=A0A9N8UZP4_9GLOM|nr:10666_t:CDS:10 [Ambispora gerdemannii]